MQKVISLSFFFSTLLVSGLFSQNITGKVLDAQNAPLAYANIALYSAQDSSMVKVELSDDSGEFKISDVPANSYWIEVSYVGLPSHRTAVFALNSNYQLPDIKLNDAGVELNEVTVTAQRPLLELKPDKMIFNVEGSINAIGSDALDLLKKAPGVIVDNNDNITMLGKSGVQVYIDGKPSPLTADDLAAYLKTMQSSEIDNIEIITNPSSKYDAEGTGGIINIKLKKDKKFGANANINLGYAQGEKKNYNGSISSNYRSKHFNVFGNYSYNDGANINYMRLYREQNGLFFDQTSDMSDNWESHNFKTGIDYSFNKQNSIGILVNGSFSDDNWNSISRTPIGMISEKTIDSVLVAESHSTGNTSNMNYNFNYRFDDGNGLNINFDVDYGRYRKDAGAFQPNFYKTADEAQTLNERIYRNETPTDIDIYTSKIDFEMPAWEGKFSFGAKFSIVQTDNTFDFYNIIEDTETLDLNRSNSFTYEENVNALYANYSKQFKNLGIQIGVRAEQTNSEGDLQSKVSTEDDNVIRDYVDLFPSAGITYQLNPKNSFQLSYSRRVNRPSYQDLNPFENKIDELTFEKGNPFLNPEYTHSIQLTHTFNYFLNTSIGYSHTTDLITRITDTVGVNETTITWLNLAEQRNYNINISGAIPITKWWNSYTNLTGYILDNYAQFEEGKTINLTVPAFSMYSQHTFSLPWDMNLELSGWYNTASIWEGNFETEQQYSIDAGLQKKLFNGKGNLRVAISDLFKTTDWAAESTFGPLYITGGGGWDSRKVRVSFSYMFGNNKVKTKKRNTGLEDESNRIKG